MGNKIAASPATTDMPTASAMPAPALAQDESSKEVDLDEAAFPRIRGYEVTGRLGNGGMGIVWRATQRSTRRPVAIKILGAGLFHTSHARLRFDREVQLTAKLEHPNIARVYESGVFEGVYFYAMELVDGTPLDRHVADKKTRRRDVLELMQRICLAVQHAHQRGVIHRDLKPSNILVTAEGQPKVLDFGLAKALPLDTCDSEGQADQHRRRRGRHARLHEPRASRRQGSRHA
jgi:serine/threonine protein kinase